MRLRKVTTADVHDIRIAIRLLRNARERFVRAGAKKTADKVRRALKSAGGAERHAQRCEERTACQ